MKFSEIHTFNELVNHQLNISRTADSINMAQSGVTRKIQSLENSFGMPLVIRQGKKLIGLTEFGNTVFEQSRNLLRQVDNLYDIADDFRHDGKGTLAIATTNTQARFFLPSIVTKFKKKFPEASLHFFQGNPQQLIHYLYEGIADIAICTESLKDDSNLSIEECCYWNHAVVIPSSHPLATQENITLHDISTYPILTYAFYLTGGGRIRQAFQQAGLAVNIVFTALDAEVIKTYVRLGHGVGIIANMTQDAKDSDLVYKPLDHLIERSVTKVAWLKEKYITEQTKTFIALVTQQHRKR